MSDTAPGVNVAKEASEQTNEAQTVVVMVRVRDPRQLFNSLDPSPFFERDLDTDAAAYIIDWVRQEPRTTKVRIQIILPKAEMENAQGMEIEGAINNYFAARAFSVDHELKELFAVGRRYLGAGVVILLLCLFASQGVQELPWGGPWKQVLSESFLILGWVANWKPIETFIYDWQPIARRRNLYRRLSNAPVELVAT